MNKDIGAFLNALICEESKFIPTLASDSLGLLLRAGINELDWYIYNLLREERPSTEQIEHSYLLQLGVPRLIGLALQARPSFDIPTVTFRRHPNLTSQALKICAGLGVIEHGRRVAQSVKAGLGQIEQLSGFEFRITLPAFLPNDEHYEDAVAEHYRSASAQLLSESLGSDSGKAVTSQVNSLLAELVYPYEDHYIGYDAHPIVDSYFLSLALHSVTNSESYDSFNPACEFGGIPYAKYIQALIFIVSIALKHERFAETLVSKNREIRLEDVLTTSFESARFLEEISSALSFIHVLSNHESALKEITEAEVTKEEARTILDVLAVDRTSTDKLSRSGSPMPPLVCYSNGSYIRSQAGAHLSPGMFLLGSLKHHFPSEYDRNQMTREQSLQRAVRNILQEAFDDLRFRDNVTIRRNGQKITDIDLTVADARSGNVLLFQLKHQDPYGLDISARKSRTDRLAAQIERWLDVTEDWLNRSTEAEIRACLRLPKSIPPITVSRVVVARHFAFPLLESPNPPDVAHGNWLMFFNAVQVVRNMRTTPTLADLLKALRDSEQPAGRQEHLREPDTEWVLDELRFTIRQESG